MGDPEFDDNFVTQPEFAYYVKNNGGTAAQYISSNTVKTLWE